MAGLALACKPAHYCVYCKREWYMPIEANSSSLPTISHIPTVLHPETPFQTLHLPILLALAPQQLPSPSSLNLGHTYQTLNNYKHTKFQKNSSISCAPRSGGEASYDSAASFITGPCCSSNANLLSAHLLNKLSKIFYTYGRPEEPQNAEAGRGSSCLVDKHLCTVQLQTGKQ